MTRTLAIVGASLAGAKAAEAARAAGFDGRIVLIGDEPHLPYERPPLSKDVLRGDKPPARARVHDDNFYADHDIELVGDTATALNAEDRHLTLASGDRVPYDTVILATGARPRRLVVPGADLAGVHYLRTVDDAIVLGDAIRHAGRVAVVGAGWIGSEVAASARQMGAEVVLIDRAPAPLHGLLGDDVGRVFRQLHADKGVHLRLGTGVQALLGRDAVEAVALSNGEREAADVVVVGIGVEPQAELAERAGIAVENGVLVDEHLQSAVPGVFAAGDVANAWHPHYRRHVRVEHWSTALNQGSTAGRNAVGAAEIYDRLPYFFSDQYDLGLEYVGHHQRGDALVVRGDLDRRGFIAFWHRDGRTTAAMNVNVWDVVDDLRSLIIAGVTVDPARLADPSVSLTELAAPPPSPARVTQRRQSDAPNMART